jgi:hypothetical protein
MMKNCSIEAKNVVKLLDKYYQEILLIEKDALLAHKTMEGKNIKNI